MPSRASLTDISAIDEDIIERVPLMASNVSAPANDSQTVSREKVRSSQRPAGKGTDTVPASNTDHLEQLASRFQPKELRRQTSFRIYPSLDEELQTRVNEYNAKRIPITREDIINEALANFLGVALPR